MAHIESHGQHAGVPRIIFGELQRAEDTPAKRAVREFMGQYVGKLQAFIEQGKAGGEIGPDVNAKAAATLFVGMIQGLVVQSLVSGSKGIPQAKAHEIFALYRLFASAEESAAMAARYRAGHFGYGTAKKALADLYERTFAPMRETRAALARDPGRVEAILKDGAARARAEARKTLDAARRAVGLA